MTRREPSLFSRLAALITLTLGGGALILAAAAWYYARAAADEAYDRLLVGAALQIAENLAVEAGALTIRLPSSAFELLGLAERDRIFYRVVDPAGRGITGYEDLGTGLDLGRIRATPVVEEGRYGGEPVRIAAVGRAFADPTVAGWAHVVVAQTQEARRALARDLTLKTLVVVAVMSLLAIGGAMLAIRLALDPLQRLGQALRRRDPHDLTPVALATPREVGPFVASINHFMGRLDERVTLLQHFVADAAHQIRTPLTALAAQVELLGQSKLDTTGRQHFTRVQDRTRELAQLTNQLLSHALVIHRADSVPLQPLDLEDVARRAFRAAVPITVDPEIVVSFEGADEPAIVAGDAVSLREAIVNVIGNALRHGARSQLAVRVVAGDEEARIEVEDDGPGIPADQWHRVTQRFGASRSQEGSAGLGFAIATEVMAAHGGALSFREKGERGFTVILSLPRLTKEGRS